MTDVIKISDDSIVEFEKPVKIMGTFDRNAISYDFKLTGTLRGVELRGILEHASSIKVRIRSIKNNLRDMTFGTLLASLGEKSATAAEALAAAEAYNRKLEAEIADLKKQVKAQQAA